MTTTLKSKSLAREGFKFPLHGWLGVGRPPLDPQLDFDRRRTHCGFFPLWLGVLLTAFFWETWNYFSYPKWICHVPWGDSLHVFKMPLLGYGEYLPFALEFYALYHRVCGLLGDKKTEYVKVIAEWFL
jgi:hypothetical protein